MLAKVEKVMGVCFLAQEGYCEGDKRNSTESPEIKLLLTNFVNIFN